MTILRTKKRMMTTNSEKKGGNAGMPRPLDTDRINTLIETQLAEWPLAKENFFNLMKVRRRPMKLGDLDCAVQLNPARIVSTGANVDPEAIAARPCFLCRSNRPAEQITTPWGEGWELLVNPFPILPVHFTIASTRHEPQADIPLEMAMFAEAAQDLAIFFNGARAGASAPDHLHLQAVLKQELPLLRLAERSHPKERGGFMGSEEMGLDLPFQFVSALITPDMYGYRTLGRIKSLFGMDAETGTPDRGLLNAFFWIGEDSLLRAVIVPRRRHRPLCYGKQQGELTISPGAIDMAGLLITPREEDFNQVDEGMVRTIYSDVAFADQLPQAILDTIA